MNEQNLFEALQRKSTGENLWDAVCFFQGNIFKTYSGLEFTYELRRGRNGEYTKELRHWGQTL